MSDYDYINPDEELEYYAAEDAADYGEHNDEMNLAWQFIVKTGVSVFLTGKAGTGKTTFLRRLREMAPKRMVVLAPTGVAAINAQGQTIHSFFQIAPGPFVPDPARRIEREQSGYRMAQSKKDLIRTLDLLVIDEVSMVRADLLDQIDHSLRQYRDRTRPFGGVQLLLIGDLMQLSPVAKGDEWQLLSQYYQTPYFFSSHALQQLSYVTVELKRIYRQQDQAFIDILAAVRSGAMTDDVLARLNKRYMPNFRPTEHGWIRLTTHNYSANQYNEARLAAIAAPLCAFDAKVTGDFPQVNYPADARLALKVGAQVMFVKNDPSLEHAYYNGKIGIVTAINKDVIEVSCPGDPKAISVTPVQWDNAKYVLDDETKAIKEQVVGSFIQYPLRLAWAITVHKSQGLTFDHAVLDVNQSFTHGQVYVALSRCRTLEGMVLAAPIRAYSVITDRTVDDYIGQQASAMENSVRQLPELKYRYTLALLDELYSFADIRRDYKWLERVVDEHLRYQAPWLLTRLRELDGPFDTKILTVANAFRQQYMTAMQDARALSPGAPLCERIKRSAVYFRDTLRSVFAEAVGNLALNIDNKQTAQTYGRAVEALRASLSAKIKIYDALAQEDFSTAAYLNAKARVMLEGEKAPLKTTRATKAKKAKAPKEVKPKTPAPKKGDSARESKALFDSGMTPEQIAAQRSLAVSTVYGHLGEFVARGDLDLDQLVTPEQQKLISLAASRFDTAYSITDLQKHLPADINAGQIRLVLNYQKRESGKT